MNTKPFHENHFNNIQALRGIAALFVLTEHVRFLNCGAFGVDIFFCISGFMIMFSTHENKKGFLIKRLIRILPLYYLMTLGTFALLMLFPSMFEQTTANPAFLIKSLLFIPFDMGGGIIQPLMRIGWTVNCEIFFYLVFAICKSVSHRFRGLLSSIVLLVIVTAGQLLSPDNAVLVFYSQPAMLEFVLGIFLYYLIRGIYEKHTLKALPPWFSHGCLLLSIVLLAILAVTKQHAGISGFGRLVLWGIPAAIIVFCVFISNLYLKMPGILVWIGNMSFSLYLIHYYPVMLLDRKVFDFSACTPRAVWGFLLSIPICLALSWVSWYLIEQKFSKWIKEKLLL